MLVISLIQIALQKAQQRGNENGSYIEIDAYSLNFGRRKVPKLKVDKPSLIVLEEDGKEKSYMFHSCVPG